MEQLTDSVKAESSLRGRVPDFFIVGHSKSGTTALYEMLRRHPQIFMPAVKEPMYFARRPVAPPAKGASRPFTNTGKRTETAEEYLALFSDARPDQLVGEASTFYLWSQIAPRRIAEAQPDARIIVILREPASFLHSLHLQMLQNRAEVERDLRKAIALESDRREGRLIPVHAYWPEALMYTERARYVEQLRRFHEHFPEPQVLVLIYDDFRDDNEATVRRVLRFLGVEEAVALESSDANPTVGTRARWFDSLVRNVRAGRNPLSRAVRSMVRGLTSHRIREATLYPLRRRIVFGTPPAPDEELTLELRRRFKPEVVALSEYLDRNLVGLWGYDRIQ